MASPAAAACFVCLLAAAGAGSQTVATLEDKRVTESSGVAASLASPGVYWTHNDSGGGPFLYAFDRQGRARGRWLVRGARNIDWEDIASGPGPRRARRYLYIGDIGDNARRRETIVVYRVEEPVPASCRQDCRTGPAEALPLRYPDVPHDAESLLVHPATGDLYIVSKTGPRDPETRVYKAKASQLGTRHATLRRLATLKIPNSLLALFAGGITGGGISPDGRAVVLSDYFGAYEARLPAGAAFDRIWEQPFTAVPLGIGYQVEGICYRADGKAIVATSEGAPAPLLEVKR